MLVQQAGRVSPMHPINLVHFLEAHMISRALTEMISRH